MGATGDEESPLSKTGMELFRELLRIYGDAEVEDYYKNGVWKEDLIRGDFQLVEAHRKEAGAPDPPPLEEVPIPELPKPTGAMAFMAGMAGMGQPGMMMGVRPLGIATFGAGAGAAAAGPVAELRLIALFVAKWKLDPTRTKSMLTKLLPQRRRHVIQTFKTTSTGIEATNALEQFIAQCEKTNSWGPAAAAGAGMAPAATSAVSTALAAATAARGLRPSAAPQLAGIKRPVGLIAPPANNPLLDPSKRPRIGPVVTGAAPGAVRTAGASPAAAALAARLAAARARGPTPPTTRPPMNLAAMQQQRMAGGVAGAGPRPMGAVRPSSAPLAGKGMIRPVAAPKAKAGEKPGDLIRNLLQKLT